MTPKFFKSRQAYRIKAEIGPARATGVSSLPSLEKKVSSDCEYVFKVAHKTDELHLMFWYGQPVAERSAILTVRVFDSTGKVVASDGNFLNTDDVPKPYLFFPPHSEPGLHRVGTITAMQRASTIKVAALHWPTLEPLGIDLFPKSFVAIERPAPDLMVGERVRTNIIPGRPNGSSK